MAITLALTASYMLAEVIGGWLSGSLALMADAGHMLSDTTALSMSLVAMWLARRPPTARHTYGYARSEILAALLNGATLIAIAIFIAVEAWGRLATPPAVKGELAMAIAAGGLLINLVALRILSRSKNESLNLRGAWLHVASDALGSVGALLSGAAIWAFGWRWADPLASLLIALLIAHAAYALLKDTVEVLMEGTPRDVDVGCGHPCARTARRDRIRPRHACLDHRWQDRGVLAACGQRRRRQRRRRARHRRRVGPRSLRHRACHGTGRNERLRTQPVRRLPLRRWLAAARPRGAPPR